MTVFWDANFVRKFTFLCTPAKQNFVKVRLRIDTPSLSSQPKAAAQPCAVLKKLKHRKRNSNFREFEKLRWYAIPVMLYIDDKRAPTTPLQFVKNLSKNMRNPENCEKTKLPNDES